MAARSLRLVASLAALSLVPSIAMAQQKTFSKGDRVVSVGFMTGGDYDGSGFGIQGELGLFPVGKATIGLGAFTGYQHKSKEAGVFKASSSMIPFMAVANLHIPLEAQPNLDLYGGVSAGLVRASAEVEGLGSVGGKSSSTDSGLGIQVGARYWLTSALGINAQIGFNDIPLIQAGASFKF